MATAQAAKLKALQQAFVTADKDGDSLLNKDEFKEFVEIGYQKQCPNGMYENLCSHFKRDPDIGIDWNTARKVWLQAQKQPNKAKSPSPPKSQNGTSSQSASSQIKQAFIQCDKDADGYLNKQEFHEFVKVGFKKPSVPNGMYEQVCSHFKKDPKQGIDWLSVFALWKQSNPNAAPTNSSKASNTNTSPKPKTTKNKTPPPKRNLSGRQPPLKRMQTAADVPSSRSKQNNNISKSPRDGGLAGFPKPMGLSPAKSTGNILTKHKKHESLSGSGSQLTERNLRALDKGNGYGGGMRGDDEVSVESDSNQSYRSSNRRVRRMNSTDRGGRGRESFDDTPDASQMVVQMMETKVKNLQNQLKVERAKRKKTEELAQSLLTQNDEYKRQITELQQSTSKTKVENKSMRDQLRKFKTQVDDDRQTIKHLTQQRNTMKSERDESFTLLTKIEKEHSMMIKKEKAKHKAEMDKLSAGFLETLGAESLKDIPTVVKQLRETNRNLKKQVDSLAETLQRKNESLMAALNALDLVSEQDQKTNDTPNNNAVHSSQNSNGKMRDKLRSLNQRRKSLIGKNNSISDLSSTGLPKPPKRRNSQVGLTGPDGKMGKPHHRPTATFFKRAMGGVNGNNNELNVENAKHGKELQFVSQKLTSDVADKTESIQNLEIANTALLEQMAKMQKQMDVLQGKDGKHKKQESTASINDLP